MIPCLQQRSLEIEGNREQSDDHVSQGEVGDEVVGHGLKIVTSLSGEK